MSSRKRLYRAPQQIGAVTDSTPRTVVSGRAHRIGFRGIALGSAISLVPEGLSFFQREHKSEIASTTRRNLVHSNEKIGARGRI